MPQHHKGHNTHTNPRDFDPCCGVGMGAGWDGARRCGVGRGGAGQGSTRSHCNTTWPVLGSPDASCKYKTLCVILFYNFFAGNVLEATHNGGTVCPEEKVVTWTRKMGVRTSVEVWWRSNVNMDSSGVCWPYGDDTQRTSPVWGYLSLKM